MSTDIITDQSVGLQLKPASTTRQRLIQIASELFASKGYHGTSTHDIAMAANIQKSSLFHHFAKKEQILEEAIDALQVQCQEHIFAHTQEDSLKYEQKVDRTATAIHELFHNRQVCSMVGFLATELSDEMPNLTVRINCYFNKWSDALQRLLRDHFSEEQTVLLVKDSMSLLFGALLFVRLREEDNYLDHVCRQLKKLWIEG